MTEPTLYWRRHLRGRLAHLMRVSDRGAVFLCLVSPGPGWRIADDADPRCPVCLRRAAGAALAEAFAAVAGDYFLCAEK